MATTKDHILARGDSDLLQRLIAKAEQMGLDSASSWIQNNMGKLVTVDVAGGQTVTDVYAYANNVRNDYINNTPPPPGANLGAVTDAQLEVAIQSVRAEEVSNN